MLLPLVSFSPAWSSSEESSSPPGYSQFPCGYFKNCSHNAIINGTAYSILYNIVGEPYGDAEKVKVIDITANTELKALSMRIETDQNGTFRIQIPRAALTDLGLESDADLIVLADGKDIDSGKAVDDQSITLGGNFTKDTREILIGDSRYIPEFNSLAATTVIAVAVGVIIMSKRTFHQKLFSKD